MGAFVSVSVRQYHKKSIESMKSQRNGTDDQTYTWATEPAKAVIRTSKKPCEISPKVPHFLVWTFLLFVSKLLILQWYATMEEARKKLMMG